MSFTSPSVPLPESVFVILQNLIHQETGLYFENYKRQMLADKLAPRLLAKNLNSFLDYYYLLKYDPLAEVEWQEVMDVLSVPETFFWREVDQIQALVTVILPQYYEKYLSRAIPQKTLRIWSAACATGEEALSIAIALNEKGWFEKMPIEIYASDAAKSLIQKAKKGIYRDRSIRKLPLYYQQKYLSRVPDGWRISPSIHSKIQWHVANLMNPPDLEKIFPTDIIFCRNVFIYFSEKAVEMTANRFYSGLSTPGYLFIGASESLLKFETEFELTEIQDSFVYVKK